MIFRKTKKSLLVIIVGLIVLVAAGFFVVHKHKSNQGVNSSGNTPTPSINYNPPTEEEKDSGNQQKSETTQKEQERNDTSGQNTQKASVIITDANQYGDTIEVRAFIPDHYQDGTCTITITKDQYKVTKSTPAYRDASTTICTNPLFTRSEFAVSGEWQVVVSYSSAGATGISNSQLVNIN